MRKRYGYACIAVCVALLGGCGQAESEIAKESTVNLEDSMGKMEASAEVVEEDSVVEGLQADEVSDGLIFLTDYIVEDYCHGCFIVSKNDGLLYGVLDKKGEEILPVKFDDITFMNSDELEKGTDTILYIKTKYEDEYTVVDQNGKKLLDKNVEYTSYAIDAVNDNSYCFVENNRDNHILNFYKKDGTYISEIDYYSFMDESAIACIDGSTVDTVWISENNYIINVVGFFLDGSAFGHTTVFDKEHKIVKEWQQPVYLNWELLNNVFTFYTSENGYRSYSIDKNGTLVENGFFKENDLSDYTIINDFFVRKSFLDTQKTEDKAYTLGMNNEIKLYQSNDTWKLVDASNNPLYDERYYGCFEKSGCYFLINEDNQMCLIDRNGKRLVDYGYLTWNGSEGQFKGMVLTSDNFFVGDDGVCFVQGSEVYLFSEK